MAETTLEHLYNQTLFRVDFLKKRVLSLDWALRNSVQMPQWTEPSEKNSLLQVFHLYPFTNKMKEDPVGIWMSFTIILVYLETVWELLFSFSEKKTHCSLSPLPRKDQPHSKGSSGHSFSLQMQVKTTQSYFPDQSRFQELEGLFLPHLPFSRVCDKRELSCLSSLRIIRLLPSWVRGTLALKKKIALEVSK